jgi:hypothetical protein
MPYVIDFTECERCGGLPSQIFKLSKTFEGIIVRGNFAQTTRSRRTILKLCHDCQGQYDRDLKEIKDGYRRNLSE